MRAICLVLLFGLILMEATAADWDDPAHWQEKIVDLFQQYAAKTPDNFEREGTPWEFSAAIEELPRQALVHAAPLLASPNPKIRYLAMDCLGYTVTYSELEYLAGTEGFDIETVNKYLLQALDDDVVGIRRKAIHVLGHHGVAEALPKILRLLFAPESIGEASEPLGVRKREEVCLYAVSTIVDGPESVVTNMWFLSDEDVSTRFGASHAIPIRGNSQRHIVPILVGRLVQEERELVQQALGSWIERETDMEFGFSLTGERVDPTTLRARIERLQHWWETEGQPAAATAEEDPRIEEAGRIGAAVWELHSLDVSARQEAAKTLETSDFDRMLLVPILVAALRTETDPLVSFRLGKAAQMHLDQDFGFPRAEDEAIPDEVAAKSQSVVQWWDGAEDWASHLVEPGTGEVSIQRPPDATPVKLD